MFAFEVKKLFRKKSTLFLLALYLGMSIFWFTQFAFVGDSLYVESDQIYELFISNENVYMSLLVIFVAFLTSVLFPMEYEKNMMPTLLVTKNGRRRLVRNKLILALLLSNILYIVSLFVILAGWVVAFGFNFDMPVVGEYIGAFAENPTITNMGSLLIILLIGGFLSVNVMTLVCLYLSNKLKKSLNTLIVVISVSFVASLCSEVKYIGVLGALSPISATQVTDSYAYLNIKGINLSIYLIGFLLYIIMIVYLVVKLRNMFKVK